jgi:hypothetical protein
MSETYIVKQGDWLAKIASRYGFTDFKTIWDDPQNAKLKQQRKNPNVLFPGDQLFIPDKTLKQESAVTQQKHRFELKKPKITLRLILEDACSKPIANASCELSVEDETFKLVSDSKGKIEQEIPANAQKATLIVKDSKTPIHDDVIPIQIGHLDPVDEVSGQRARLNNLGYFTGPSDIDDEMPFRRAVGEFQLEHLGRSEVDGKCGPKTQAKLLEVHGC